MLTPTPPRQRTAAGPCSSRTNPHSRSATGSSPTRTRAGETRTSSQTSTPQGSATPQQSLRRVSREVQQMIYGHDCVEEVRACVLRAGVTCECTLEGPNAVGGAVGEGMTSTTAWERQVYPVYVAEARTVPGEERGVGPVVQLRGVSRLGTTRASYSARRRSDLLFLREKTLWLTILHRRATRPPSWTRVPTPSRIFMCVKPISCRRVRTSTCMTRARRTLMYSSFIYSGSLGSCQRLAGAPRVTRTRQTPSRRGIG